MQDMSDSELRELCHRFFDAIETGDIATVDACYSPDLKFWFNVTGQTIGKDASLKALQMGAGVQRRRTYNDRIVQTFETGFMVQYSLNIVLHNGKRRTLWACVVAECRGGQIYRMNEYLDSSKFGIPFGKKKPEEKAEEKKAG